jgi:hypothetical protein
MTPSWPEYTKSPPQTGGSSYFLIEKSPNTAFFNKNLYQDIVLKHFVRNRYRTTNNFTSVHFELYLLKILGVIYAPSHPD